MAFDWKSLVATVAPTIASTFGGPLAGLGVSAVIKALGLEPDGGEPQIAAALQGATADQLLALKKADQDFAVQMKQLDIDLEKINAGDRDSARVMQSQVRSNIPGTLAVTITLGFFGILGYMLIFGLKKEMAGADAFLIMLGSLGTAWIAVVTFYFGSSMGSANKDMQLAAMRAK